MTTGIIVKHTPLEGFVAVSEERFFETVGPMNVHPRPERERTFWETPGREVIGITTPGYLGGGLPASMVPRTYSIKASLAKSKGGEQ